MHAVLVIDSVTFMVFNDFMDVMSHYSLKEIPYAVSPNPRFLFLNPVENAINKIRLSVQSREGLVILTGDIGAGKTTTLNYVTQVLQEQGIRVGVIKSTYSTPYQLLRMINRTLGNDQSHNNYLELLELLKVHVVENSDENCTLLLDEADQLSKKQFDLIKDLLNVESPTTKYVQVVLIGSDELRERLKKRWYKALNSRGSLWTKIYPLSEQEVKELLLFRWLVAGGKESSFPFDKSAISRITEITSGNQRSAVWLAKWCLFRGAAFQLKTIDKSTVDKSYSDWKDEEAFHDE